MDLDRIKITWRLLRFYRSSGMRFKHALRRAWEISRA